MENRKSRISKKKWKISRSSYKEKRSLWEFFLWAAIYSIMTVIFVWSAFEIAKSAMNVFYHQPSIYMIVFLIAFVSQTADGICIYYKRYMARHAVNLGSLIFYLVLILHYAVKNEDKFL